MAARISELVSSEKPDDIKVFRIMEAARKGIAYKAFAQFARELTFTLQDWSHFLNVSARTLQRLKKENKAFDQAMSERIFQIAMLNSRGQQVLGSRDGFMTWIQSDNVSLGGRKPRALLDSSFGIDLLLDELTRIEHGVLA